SDRDWSSDVCSSDLGKTTTLNTLAMFIKPNAKIVSIEDTSEIQLPHENWLSSVVRAGFGVTGEVSEITLFDLLKNAMRQRPEYRSEERRVGKEGRNQ